MSVRKTPIIIGMAVLLPMIIALSYIYVYGDATRTSGDACGCHPNYMIYVTIKSHDMPSQLDKGTSGTLHVEVEVSGYGGSGPKSTVDLTVSVYDSNSLITFSNTPQSVNGVSAGYINTFSFGYSALNQGRASVTMSAEIKPHTGPSVKDSVQAVCDIIEANHPPELVDGGVNPVNGTKDDIFVFYVTYIDLDGDYPSYIKVYIDNTPYDMYVSDGAADTITTGERYEYSVMGSTLGLGDHTYRFEASDGSAIALGDTGEKNGPRITDGNTPPVLSNGMVTPTTGSTEDSYKYRVTYSDADGDLPLYIRVIIDESRSFDLQPEDGKADTIITGEIYSIDGITFTTTGSHTYRFEASDGSAGATGDVNLKSGPVVTDGQNNPPEISSVAFDPKEGYPGWTYNFSFTYRDADGDAPAKNYPRIYIVDGNESIITYSLMSKSQGTDFTLGVVYEDAITIDFVGQAYFYIEVSDGDILIRSDTYTGPVINPLPENHAPRITSLYPTTENMVCYTSTTLRFSVNATDPDGDQIYYAWYLNDQYIGNSSDEIEIEFTSPGVYDIVIKISDIPSTGTQKEISHTWIVEALRMPRLKDLHDYGENITIMKGESLVFTVALDEKPIGNVSYIWYMDSMAIASGDSNTYVFDTEMINVGTYLLIVKAQDEYGLSAVMIWNITVTWESDVVGDSAVDGDEQPGPFIVSDTSEFEDYTVEYRSEKRGLWEDIAIAMGIILVILAIAYIIRYSVR